MSEELHGRINKVLSKYIVNKDELDAVLRNEPIVGSLSIDSMAVLHMVTELEKEFQIRFNPEALEQIFENYSALSAYIENSVSNKA